MHHKHHIIPFHEWKMRVNPNATRHDKDFNSPDNIVWLTIEQHSQVHQLLFELNGNWQDEFAWKFLSGQQDFSLLNGVSKTEQHKEKLRLAALKRWESPEEREKQKQRFSGNKNPMYGKPGTMLGKIMRQDSRQKMREAKIRSGPTKVYEWEIVHSNGSKKTVTNLTEFCKESGIHQSGMIQLATGRLKSYKGYTSCKRLLDKLV